jgi:hypothetical protein
MQGKAGYDPLVQSPPRLSIRRRVVPANLCNDGWRSSSTGMNLQNFNTNSHSS